MSSIREDQVEAAINFLGNEKVKDRPVEEKRDFLLRKGLTEAEVAEALQRFGNGSGGGGVAAGSNFPPPVTPSYPSPSYPSPPAPQQPPYGGYPPWQGQPQPGGWQGQPQPGYGVPGPQWPQPGGPGPYGMMQPPYEAPQSAGSGPGWAWGLGGIAAGLGLTFMANKLSQRSQEKLDQGAFNDNSAWAQHQQQHMQAQLQLKPPMPLAETLALGKIPAAKSEAEVLAAIKPSGEEGDEKEKSTKEVYEDLLSLLRTHGDEARETSALFRKCITQQQEQHQTVFNEMVKTLTSQSQQQKVQKSVPTELSATTLQSLASLIEGSKSGEPMTDCGNGNAGLSGGPAVVNPLRESFDAISQNLNRLVNESASKAEASKSLNTLSLILQNLLSQPTSTQHRKVNTSSIRFAELKKGARAELLKLAGFEEQGVNFVMPAEQNLEAAERARDLIVSKQRTLDQDWEARPAAEPTAGRAAGGAVGDDSAARARSSSPLPSHSPPQPCGAPAGALQPLMQSASSGGDDLHLQPQHGASAGTAAAAQPALGGGGGAAAAGSVHAGAASAEGVGEGARRAARPWQTTASQKPGAVAPSRPWEVAAPPTSQGGNGAAVAEGGGGDEDTQQPPPAVVHSQVASVPPTMPMAHPAESPEGQSIAHPAESEDRSSIAQPAESEDVPQSFPLQQQQEQQHAAAQPPEAPLSQTSSQGAMAHPAEGSNVSEEPQSGG